VRTTTTIDDDLHQRLRAVAAETSRPFSAVLNEALRRGLRVGRDDVEPFVVKARDMGLRAEVDLDDVEGLLDLVEGDARR
jgi:predicted transcriptional regulator